MVRIIKKERTTSKGGKTKAFSKAKDRRGKKGVNRVKHLKKVLSVCLVFLLFVDLVPLTIGDVSPKRPTNSYGVEQGLDALQEKRHSEKWDNIIKSEAEGELDAIDITKQDRTPPSIDEQVIIMGPSPTPDPSIYNIIETTTLANRLTLIEFLISQPTSYYIFTNTGGNQKWTQGLLRGSLLGTAPWVQVDVDDDINTGDMNGYDIRARIDVAIDSFSIHPFPLRDAYALIKGGLDFQVEKIPGPNATTSLPLEIYVVKSFSYTGNNFLWMVGFQWSNMPNMLNATMTADRMKMDPPSIFNITGGLADFMNVVSIEGPYDITFDMDVRPPDMVITVANARAFLRTLTERVWSRIVLTPADGLNRVPEQFTLHLESPSFNKSFDTLRWTSTIPANFQTSFKDLTENTTVSNLLIDDIPTYLLIELNDIKDQSGTVTATNVHLDLSDTIKVFDYWEYEFYGTSVTDFTHSHTILTDIPKRLHINGTFQIGGEDPEPENNLAIGFIANFMNNMMQKLLSKFHRISETLRTIPNNIINMPNNKGWGELTILDGEAIGGFEFYVSSRSRIEAQGDYLAFRNDTQDINMDPSLPLVNSSLSGHLTDIQHMKIDFSTGTFLDLDLVDPRPVRILFIDDVNKARATLMIEDVPEHLNLKFREDKIDIKSNRPIQTLSYTSLVGPQYFRLMLEDLPTELSIDQTNGRLKLMAQEDSSIGSFSVVVSDRQRLDIPDERYNHIYLDRTQLSYMTSIRLNEIRSIDMQTAKGGLVKADFAEERNLFISLSDFNLDVETRILFKPFPSNFSMELPEGFTISGVRMPNVLNVSSIFAFGPIILQMSQLARDIVDMTSELTENIANQMGSIGTNTTIKLKSKVPTVLIADMRQGPAQDIEWVHGVNVHIDDSTSAIRARIYLRLPLEADINIRSEGDVMDIHIDFKSFTPLWEFLDFRIIGMGERDVSLYIDGLTKETQDVLIDSTLETNMTPGSGAVNGKIMFRADYDVGPMYLNMRKKGEIMSSTTVFITDLARRLDCNIDVKDRLSLDWAASKETKNLYVLIQKVVDGDWYDVSLTLNKVPTRLSIMAGTSTNSEMDMDGSLLQGLPEISINGNTVSLSIYLYMQGKAMGMPSTYEIHMRDVTDNTFTMYDPSNDVYKIRSEGTAFFYMRIMDMPYTEKFRIKEAELYVDEIYSMDLRVHQVFGTYPIIEIENFNADTLQFRTTQMIQIFGTMHEGNIIYVDISTRDGIPWATGLTRNGINIDGGDYHMLIPAPMATMTATLFGGS